MYKILHFAHRFMNMSTNLININSCKKKLQRELNLDLKGLYKWLLANKISLNSSKTELVIFRKPSETIPTSFKIKLHGQRIYPSDSIKYLGIYLDEHLNGSTHVKMLLPKLKRANGMLAKVRHYTSPTELKSIYSSIFSCHMTYGCQIWGQSYTNSHINKVQTLQNNALRLITFAPSFRDHVTQIYHEQGILKIKDHITLLNTKLVHDYLNNNLPLSFDNFFILDRDARQYDENNVRPTKVPQKFANFVFPDQNLQPQDNTIPGQLFKG